MKQEQDTVIAGILYKVVCTDSLQSWANWSWCNPSGYRVISSPTKLALHRTVAPCLPSWERRVNDRGGRREVCKHNSPSSREMGEGASMDYNLHQVHAFNINKDDTAWLDARAFLQWGWCLCSEEQTVAFETDEILPLSLNCIKPDTEDWDCKVHSGEAVSWKVFWHTSCIWVWIPTCS